MRIRSATPADAAALLAIYAPYVTDTAITFEYEVPSEAEFRSRIQKTLATHPYLVAEQDGQIVGYAYASTFKGRAAYDWSVELSIYCARECQRQGIGTALYAALEAELYRRNFRNLYACIAYPDPEDEYLTLDSVKFHEKQGYTLCGTFHRCGYKFGRWYHMVWMEKRIRTDEPTEPIIR